MKIVTLPLPSKILSPNARVHWMRLSVAKKAARRLAAMMAFHQVGIYKFEGYRLDFYWPDARRRDDDNASTSCKAYLDGISDCVGQDDSNWKHNGVQFFIDRKNPRVEIVFTQL